MSHPVGAANLLLIICLFRRKC